MSLLDKFRATLTGSPRTTTASAPAPQSGARKQSSPREDPSVGLSITSDGDLIISTPGDDRFDFPVTPEEIAAWTSQYDYVLAAELPALERKHRWWDEGVQKKRLKANSGDAHAWLLPFVSAEAISREELQPVRGGSFRGIQFAIRNLRTSIRELRRQKQPHEELLQALYGLAVLAGFAKGLSFAGHGVHSLAPHVDIRELEEIKVAFPEMGYQRLDSSLSKTDVKWLVAAYGEPEAHHSVHSLFPEIRRNAISRFCWAEIRKSNQSSKRLGGTPESIGNWLEMIAGIQIRIEKYRLARGGGESED